MARRGDVRAMGSIPEEVRRATVALARAPHVRADDEDLHPPTLDLVERELDAAIKALEQERERAKAHERRTP